jgi:Mg2+/Co2+ transporter CorC
LKRLVGDIQDEYDVEAQEVVPEKRVYLINPIISIDEFNKKFNANIPWMLIIKP